MRRKLGSFVDSFFPIPSVPPARLGEALTFTLLVTGFGAFPGARHNPTLDLIAALQRREARFARLGIRLEARVLPVIYAEIGPRLAKITAEIAPDAILHFGLAGQRKSVSIETRALNRVNLLHPDAGGSCAKQFCLVPGGPMIVRARTPTGQIAAALRRAGLVSRLSRDAGTYLCNAALYHSLVARHAASVGFIHIPWPARRGRRGSTSPRPTFAELVKAAEIAILEIAVSARRLSR
jgi:pyroglutamyl-peptidase